jgi:hypothetical protein
VRVGPLLSQSILLARGDQRLVSELTLTCHHLRHRPRSQLRIAEAPFLVVTHRDFAADRECGTSRTPIRAECVHMRRSRYLILPLLQAPGNDALRRPGGG